MPLHSSIDPTSQDFARNAEVMRSLVAELHEKLSQVAGGGVPMANLAVHFHDTYGQALANLYAGMEEGARVIDPRRAASAAAPMRRVPPATSRPRMWSMLEGMGITTGVEMPKLVAATNEVSKLIGRLPVSRLAAAMNAKARAAK